MNAKQDIGVIFGALPYTSRFTKGDIIYHQGDLAESFYFLKKGKVRVYMTSPDGIERTLSEAGEGDIIGEAAFFDKMPRISSASAQTDIELAVIDEDRLLSLIGKNPRLAAELLEMQAARVRELSAQIDAMTFLNADGRIARLLLSSLNENGEVNLTHEEIAGIAAVTRVTVSKILRKFRTDGLIRTAYRRIIVLDSERLRELTL